MRIAIIGKKYPFCGIVTYCREIIAALRQRGHTVAFYYLYNGEVQEEYEDGIPYLLRTHLYVVPKGDAKQRLYARLRQFKPDVVHASYALSFLDLALPELCARLGVPLVVTFHPAFDRRPSFYNRVSAMVYRMYAKTLSHSQRVIVFSEPQRQRLLRLGVPGRVLRILPNGVDVMRYRPGESQFRRSLGADVLLTYMGRLDPEKNVGTLLKIFTSMDMRPGVHLALMGDGVLGAKLRAQYPPAENLHWLGFVRDEAERIDVLRGSDIFVLPSSVEGLSIALLEAMACGCAPVATDVGGDGDVIEGCGRVLDPTELKTELPIALESLLGNPTALARLRQAARVRVEERYDLRRNLDRLLDIYEEVTPGGRRLLRS